MSVAIAFFVKTPRLTPVKTRLAASIGQRQADEVYIGCIKIIEAFAIKIQHQLNVKPYWAVAEQDGMQDSLWQNLSRIYAGASSLGEAQHQVYGQLLRHHSAVMLSSTDTPQISMKIITDALATLSFANDFVCGPAVDGGYYLLGGSKPINSSIWQAVTYSSTTTLSDLASYLEKIAKIQYLPTLIDIDKFEDLLAVQQDYPALKLYN